MIMHSIQWLKWKCVAGGGAQVETPWGIPSPANYGVVRSPAGSGARPRGRKSLVHFICHICHDKTHPVKEKVNLFIDILTQINLQL